MTTIEDIEIFYILLFLYFSNKIRDLKKYKHSGQKNLKADDLTKSSAKLTQQQTVKSS